MADPVIHILQTGAALCGFCGNGLPRDWPPGNDWVSLAEGSKATCEDCLTQAVYITGSGNEPVAVEPPREWIFTFGGGHYHPCDGASLARRFVRIAAADAEAARIEMEARFGIKWAFQYKSEAEAGVEQHGLVELGQNDAHVELLKKRQAAQREPERTSVRAYHRTIVRIHSSPSPKSR